MLTIDLTFGQDSTRLEAKDSFCGAQHAQLAEAMKAVRSATTAMDDEQAAKLQATVDAERRAVVTEVQEFLTARLLTLAKLHGMQSALGDYRQRRGLAAREAANRQEDLRLSRPANAANRAPF